MENNIVQLSKDIANFDNTVSEHIKGLKEVRDGILKDITLKTKELENLLYKNNIENKRTSELFSQAAKLKTDIINYTNRIKNLQMRANELKLNEQEVSDIKNKIDSLNALKSKTLIEVELIKTDNRQSLIKQGSIKDDINRLEQETKLLIDKNNTLSNKISEQTNKIANTEKRLKYLQDEKEIKSKNLNEIKNKITSLEKEYNNYEDKINSINGDVEQINIKKNNLEDEIKILKTSIKEMNEVKDNITHQITNEKNKNRNEENRLLALKKEVINFILENKDISNKQQLAKFVSEVENA